MTLTLSPELEDKMKFSQTSIYSDILTSIKHMPFSEEKTETDVKQQSGKRCGVIFVDTQIIERDVYDKRRETNWRTNPCTKVQIKRYSFITVKGKYSGIWSLPKGRMTDQDKETEEQCAIREVYEEIGILLPSVSHLPKIKIGRNVYFIYHVNKKDFSNFEIHDNFEVEEVAWKTIEELKQLTCNKDLRAILKYPHKNYYYHKLIFCYRH